jgi:hypothetical protein
MCYGPCSKQEDCSTISLTHFDSFGMLLLDIIARMKVMKTFLSLIDHW